MPGCSYQSYAQRKARGFAVELATQTFTAIVTNVRTDTTITSIRGSTLRCQPGGELIDRRKYIGGTASTILMGVDPYANWPDLFDYMTGRRDEDFDPNRFHIHRGNAMEPIIIEMLREIDPFPINAPHHFEKYDHGGADPSQIFLLEERPDGLVGGHLDAMSDAIIYEIKCPAMRNLQMYRSSGTPLKYFIQLQNYMRITGHDRGEVILFDYDRWTLIRIPTPANPEIWKEMERRYDLFLWHVKNDIRPESMLPPEEWHVEVDSTKLDMTLEAYENAKNLRYEAEEAQGDLKHQILDLLAGSPLAVTDNYQVSVSDRERKSYDAVTGEDKISRFKVLTVKERMPVSRNDESLRNSRNLYFKPGL